MWGSWACPTPVNPPCCRASARRGPKSPTIPSPRWQPNLGVVLIDNRDMVLADIPGLIEGAHTGAGLGHTFLRHIERTRVLIHLLNGISPDPLGDYEAINQELALFNPTGREAPDRRAEQDGPARRAGACGPRSRASCRQLGVVEPLAISAVTGEGRGRRCCAAPPTLLAELPAPWPRPRKPDQPETRRPRPPEDKSFTVERDPDGAWRVSGRVHRADRQDDAVGILRCRHALPADPGGAGHHRGAARRACRRAIRCASATRSWSGAIEHAGGIRSQTSGVGASGQAWPGSQRVGMLGRHLRPDPHRPSDPGRGSARPTRSVDRLLRAGRRSAAQARSPPGAGGRPAAHGRAGHRRQSDASGCRVSTPTGPARTTPSTWCTSSRASFRPAASCIS